MKSIVEVIKQLPDFIGADGKSETEIAKAESLLGVAFAKDYRQYLRDIGLACFDGHELTGIANISRVDVVTVTLEQREKAESVPKTWYVIEEINVDGIVIWQNEAGEVFRTSQNCSVIKIADSLLEYISW